MVKTYLDDSRNVISMEVVVDRRAYDFLWHKIKKSLDPLVAIEHTPRGAQAEHKLLVARRAEIILIKLGERSKKCLIEKIVYFKDCGYLC